MPVYFVKGERTGLVKIGVATDVKQRLIGLQIGSPDRLCLIGTVEGDAKTEGQFHALFREKNVFGEWFQLDGEELAAIDIITTMSARSQPTRFFTQKPKLDAIAAIAERDELLRRVEHLNKVVSQLRSVVASLRERLDEAPYPAIQLTDQGAPAAPDRRSWWPWRRVSPIG